MKLHRKKSNLRIILNSSLIAYTFKTEAYFQLDSKQPGEPNRNVM